LGAPRAGDRPALERRLPPPPHPAGEGPRAARRPPRRRAGVPPGPRRHGRPARHPRAGADVNAETRERSFWSYLGCGCGLLAALGLVAGVALSWVIFPPGKEGAR